MIGALVFYFFRTLKNRIRSRLKRLREPKYFISLMGGLAYVYIFFLRPVIQGTPGRIPPTTPLYESQNYQGLLETGFSLLLLCLVLLPWIFPLRGGGIVFTQAEVQFLFAAPVSRLALLHFRIAKGQFGILFGVILSFFLFGMGGRVPHPAFFLAALWVVYSFLALYRMATLLTQTSLAEHGVIGIRRHIWVLLLLAITLVSLFVWLRWFLPGPPAFKDLTARALFQWISALSESGPGFYLLYPFRLLVRPAFAENLGSFLFRIIPALSILLLSYFWVIRSDASFEEASVERAEKTARRLELMRAGTRDALESRAGKVGRPPFRLEAEGYPFVALFWKNLTAAGRFGSRRLLPTAVAVGLILLIASLTLRESARHTLSMIVGSTALGMCGFLTFAGPVVQRDDLRTDLLHLDWLKTFPLSGWMVVLGEVLAPTAILVGMNWVLIIVALCFLPNMGSLLPRSADRILIGSGAAILLPGFALLGVLIQNAAALLLPGWVRLGKDQQQGIEAMGQRMITMAASLILLFCAIIPSGILFAAAYLVGRRLLGVAIIPLAALVALAGILFEAVFIIAWLGRLFERFDASRELLES